VTLLLADHLISPAPAYQWGGAVAISAFMVMGALVLFVFRIGRSPLIVSFLIFYTLQTALRAYIMRWHLPAETLFVGTLTSAPFFLFTFYMITDPQTSPARPRDQVLTALAITLVDLWLHKRESLYTFYYAAFAVGVVRFGFLHLRAGLECAANRRGSGSTQRHGEARRDTEEGKAGFPPRLCGRVFIENFAGLRPVVVVGAMGLAGWMIYTAVIQPGAGPVEVSFRLAAVLASQSGITARLGDTLSRVDPRVQHIAKWVLSQGSAVAVGDYDNDGLLDLFVTSPLSRPEDRAVLYRNLGNFRFQRVPIPCLDTICRDPARYGLISGAVFVDYDNDGDQDLFLTVGFGRCLLLRNTLSETGRAGFVDETARAGISEYTVSLAAQFFDFDRDGRLDLLIANAMGPYLPGYPRPTPLSLFHLPPREYPGDRRMFHFMHDSWYNATNGGLKALYRNMGHGRFRKLDARRWGMPETHWSLAIGTGDLNHDGWTDLYVANDFGPDDVYLNNFGHGFVSVRGAFPGSIGRDTYKGMNVSLGDVDRSGNLAIYVSNVHEPLQAEGSLFWIIHPGALSPGALAIPEFTDEAARRGVLNESRFGWGAAMGDLNNDGWLDIVQANGMVDDTPDRRFKVCPDYWYVNEKMMRAGPQIHSYADMWGDLRGRCLFGKEANRVYLNRGDRSRPQFVDVAKQVGWTELSNSRGVALADLDNDGALDVVVTHPFAPLSLYRNTLYEAGGGSGSRAPGDGFEPRRLAREARHARPHWIGFRLVGDGVHCSRDAVGSQVTLSYVVNGRPVRQLREIQLANGFSAQGDRRALFGLGEFDGPLTVRVAWYGGAVVEYTDLRPDRYYTLSQVSSEGE
jgi:hypothetical protein